MFEKEAEELFNKKPLGYEMKPELEIYKDGFNDGYNKALEEVKHDLMMKLKDEGVVKPLKDSIFRNERLSSQEQQELCAWIECAMDFGEKLDECAKELEQIRNERNLFQEKCEDIELNYYCDKADCQFLSRNAWHYPSRGELPKCDEETQLIFYINCYYDLGGETITRKRTVLGYYQKSFMNDDVKLFVEKSKGYSDEHLPKNVIAWKEIVLPKESE